MGQRRRTEIIRQARAALAHQVPVFVDRNGGLPGPLDCVVAAVGMRWMIVQPLLGSPAGNGYASVRLRDLEGIRLGEDPSDPALAYRAPHAISEVDPSTTGTMLHTAAATFGIVRIHEERRLRPRHRVGRVARIVEKELHLDVLDLVSLAPRKRRIIPFREITRIDFGFDDREEAGPSDADPA